MFLSERSSPVGPRLLILESIVSPDPNYSGLNGHVIKFYQELKSTPLYKDRLSLEVSASHSDGKADYLYFYLVPSTSFETLTTFEGTSFERRAGRQFGFWCIRIADHRTTGSWEGRGIKGFLGSADFPIQDYTPSYAEYHRMQRETGIEDSPVTIGWRDLIEAVYQYLESTVDPALEAFDAEHPKPVFKDPAAPVSVADIKSPPFGEKESNESNESFKDNSMPPGLS